MTYKKGQLRAL